MGCAPADGALDVVEDGRVDVVHVGVFGFVSARYELAGLERI